MGSNASWVAFHGLSKDEALRRTRMRDTGEPDRGFDSAFVGGEIPGGWDIFLSDDCNHLFTCNSMTPSR